MKHIFRTRHSTDWWWAHQHEDIKSFNAQVIVRIQYLCKKMGYWRGKIAQSSVPHNCVVIPHKQANKYNPDSALTLVQSS